MVTPSEVCSPGGGDSFLALATVVGLVIGYSSLRLSRHAFAIVSLIRHADGATPP